MDATASCTPPSQPRLCPSSRGGLPTKGGRSHQDHAPLRKCTGGRPPEGSDAPRRRVYGADLGRSRHRGPQVGGGFRTIAASDISDRYVRTRVRHEVWSNFWGTGLRSDPLLVIPVMLTGLLDSESLGDLNTKYVYVVWRLTCPLR
jgi:hypothetical protein